MIPIPIFRSFRNNEPAIGEVSLTPAGALRVRFLEAVTSEQFLGIFGWTAFRIIKCTGNVGDTEMRILEAEIIEWSTAPDFPTPVVRPA